MGYFCISEVGDDIGEHLLSVVKVVPFANVIGKHSHLDDEEEHFIDELGLGEGVTVIYLKLLAFMEPLDQHGKWHVGGPKVALFLIHCWQFPVGISSRITRSDSAKWLGCKSM